MYFLINREFSSLLHITNKYIFFLALEKGEKENRLCLRNPNNIGLSSVHLTTQNETIQIMLKHSFNILFLTLSTNNKYLWFKALA